MGEGGCQCVMMVEQGLNQKFMREASNKVGLVILSWLCNIPFVAFVIHKRVDYVSVQHEWISRRKYGISARAFFKTHCMNWTSCMNDPFIIDKVYYLKASMKTSSWFINLVDLYLYSSSGTSSLCNIRVKSIDNSVASSYGGVVVVGASAIRVSSPWQSCCCQCNVGTKKKVFQWLDAVVKAHKKTCLSGIVLFLLSCIHVHVVFSSM